MSPACTLGNKQRLWAHPGRLACVRAVGAALMQGSTGGTRGRAGENDKRHTNFSRVPGYRSRNADTQSEEDAKKPQKQTKCIRVS